MKAEVWTGRGEERRCFPDETSQDRVGEDYMFPDDHMSNPTRPSRPTRHECSSGTLSKRTFFYSCSTGLHSGHAIRAFSQSTRRDHAHRPERLRPARLRGSEGASARNQTGPVHARLTVISPKREFRFGRRTPFPFPFTPPFPVASYLYLCRALAAYRYLASAY
jgi:hypothetical protein